ncbi:MAG: four helix bundle protein [Clostridia bacterium]|nr:four helix bundle protein [Clostridia bacterium]
MSFQNYKQLDIWQKAMDLTDEIYKLIDLLPKEEMFAMSSQLRRATVSVPSNIAEGSGRFSEKEFKQFLSIAKGSLYEVETQLLICIRRDYFKEEDAHTALELCDEISRKITNLVFRLNKQ